MIDIHCHILPGIDDGPKDMDETLAMLRLAAQDGVQTIVATPHYRGPFGEPEADLIRSLAARVSDRARSEGIPVEVLPGAEVRMALELPAQLERGRLLTLADAGRYLLVEIPPEPLPLFALDVHFRLRMMGVTPILAHAERVAVLPRGRELVREFGEREGLVQLNVAAVSGESGWRTKRICRGLIEAGIAQLIASDGHSATSRPPVLTPCLRGFPRRERPTVLERFCGLDVRRSG